MIVRHVGLSAFFSMLSGDVTGGVAKGLGRGVWQRGVAEGHGRGAWPGVWFLPHFFHNFFWLAEQKSVAIFRGDGEWGVGGGVEVSLRTACCCQK